MKQIAPLLLLLFLGCKTPVPQTNNGIVVTQDIHNFWEAYDKIVSTSDSAKQQQYLQKLFLDKGTPGLKAIRMRRQYDADSYLNAINNYPKFWESIRANTLQSTSYSKELEAGIEKLRKLYPDLKPAKIYFTIGALRTNGTTMDSMVLIGSELAMGDTETVTAEFPPRFGHLRGFFDNNPIQNIVHLNIHEYVHTQQRPQIGYDLLSQCLLEGVAEFVAAKANNIESREPCVTYGKKNEDKVRQRMAMEVGSPHWNDWLYNDYSNGFGVRDMGYYVGYAICEAYLAKATDKKQAIKELIELNYGDRDAVEALVNKSDYFSQPIADLRVGYEAERPKVIKISGIENGDQEVDPFIKKITLEFSKPLVSRFRNQRIGPLGMDYLLPLTGIKLSKDGRTLTYGIKLEPSRRYQLSVTDQFRDANGRVLVPYLIDFRTGKN